MMTNRAYFMAILAACASVVAACGSSDGSTSVDSGGTGGAGGSAGGSAGAGCNPGCGALEECSSAGFCVAASVPVAGGYKIDATEVTRAQYASWLDTNPSLAGLPEVCSTINTYTPTGEWPPGDQGNYPVTSVSWCDAYMYCKGVGKRLCGQIGGGGVPDGAIDATKSQWYAACSAGGVNQFPYGGSYETTACNGKDAANGGPVEVGSMPACVSETAGYEGVYDLSGNVAEWIDSCSSSTGWCLALGGSYNTDATGWPNKLGCDAGGSMASYLSSSTVGFRCCSD